MWLAVAPGLQGFPEQGMDLAAATVGKIAHSAVFAAAELE
jgi:hypothetical protein